jgi:phosphoribosylpyrophosphate synthetase
VLDRGQVAVDHNRASDRGFRVTSDVANRRVLLIDDTLTSGARLQSAASVLQLAGAEVVAGLVVGRVYDPTFGHRSQELWDHARSRPFSFDSCCIEEPQWTIPPR